jgi:anti-sigma factor RsiW
VNGVHLGDDAELYALGALEPAEQAAVEAHLAECEDCSVRVGQAEEVAAALAAALPQYEPPARLGARLSGRYGSAAPLRGGTIYAAFALAAAIVAGFFGWQNLSFRSQQAQQTLAFTTMVNSHFLHVPMQRSNPAAPNAKVLYARDGAWVYVLADKPVNGLHVVLLRNGVQRDAGTLAVAGGAASLFVPDAGRPDEVMLTDAAGPKSAATLAYPASVTH